MNNQESANVSKKLSTWRHVAGAVFLSVLAFSLASTMFGSVKADGYSHSNSVQDFRAEGRTTGAEYIKATPSWSPLYYRNQWIVFSSFASLYWEQIGAWLVAMVNVTSTNFYIAFLYLYNDRNDFWLFLYEYATGQWTWLKFTGYQSISSQTVNTFNLPVPSLQIAPQPKYSNKIFVVGPAISITGNIGKMGGKTVYSLLNLFNVTGKWNELWLLSNDYYRGAYEFTVIYTYYDSPTHVYAGYSLRLNDYDYVVPSRESLGTWYSGTSTPISEFSYGLPILLSSVLLILIIPRRRCRRFKTRWEYPNNSS